MNVKKLGILLIVIIVGIFFLHSNYSFKKVEKQLPKVVPSNANFSEVAIFAGGCFWCTEADFEKVYGVGEVVSGYIGGDSKPTYEKVARGQTKHREAVQFRFDPNLVTYQELVDYFFRHINPTDNGGQFADRGFQYTTAIYFNTEEQEKIANERKQNLIDSKKFLEPVITRIVEASTFYPAEDYHQNYYKKNKSHYERYREGSGRNKFLRETWLEPDPLLNKVTFRNFIKLSQTELKKILTKEQYKITQENGTERAFSNEFWDNKEEGIYVDIVSGEPLFSSRDKFISGTGWPSFTKPIDEEFVIKNVDYKLLYPRIELRSRYGDSHLGHVFPDGPVETGGLRYCINSAALRFVPASELVQQGYKMWSKDFQEV